MDVSDLRVFEAVARLRNMNRAAEELNTVQSNVTARIRQLEQELGVRLFDRHSRGVHPTSAGQRLLPYALDAMNLVRDARRAATDDGPPSGPLVVGSLETTLAMRLSRPIAAFVESFPAVDLTIRTSTSEELIEFVLAREIEGAFVCGPVKHADLDETICFTEELALMTGSGFERLDDVLKAPSLKQIVLRAGCSYRQRLEDIFARRGIVAVKTLEFATLEAVVSGVAAGVGVTLMPRHLVGSVRAGDRIRVHRLPADESDVETVFVRRRDAYVSRAQAAFLERAAADAGTSRAAE